jgi:ATP-dependent helicase/nuclease subunit B
MTRAPDPALGAPGGPDPVMVGLGHVVASAKGPDPLAPVTVVAPSAYAALSARRALGAAPGAEGRHGVANVSCTTVDKLLRQLGAPVLGARDLRLAPGPVDLEAIRTRAQASAGWLAELVRHPRGVVSLGRAVAELRRCPAPTLDALAPGRGWVGELVQLVDDVRAHLHGRGFADPVDLAAAAAEAVTEAGAGPRSLGRVLVFEPGPMAPAEQQLLDLVRAWGGTGPVVAGTATPTATDVRACADPDEEVRAAVRAVVALADAGVPCWAQAIFHPPGSTYARALHQELASAGVPANGPDTRRLDRTVAGATLLALLELAGSDWRRDEVMAWLSTAPLVAGSGGRRMPASRWDALSSEAGVVRGASQWAERLRNLATRHPEYAQEAGALGAFVAGLVTEATPPVGSWTTHARWAVDLLDRYLDPDPGSWPAPEVAATAQVRGTVLALGELDAVSDRSDHGVFLRAARTVLEETTLDTSDMPDGGFGDGVFVAPFGQARGLRFDAVVVVGMADAVVPGARRDDALLPEEIRRLDTSGGLRTRAARVDELHGDVVAALGAGARRRVVTYPRVEPRTGRAQVPSRWMMSFTAVATRWRSVDSFAAGVAAANPPVSVRELELHDMARWAARGRDAALSPPARSSGRLQVGITAARERMSERFTRFDGYVGAGLVSPFMRDTPMSATRLEAYAKCPRRFLYDRVLGVSRRTRPEELWQMEPAERGTLMHAILEEYLLERLAGAPRSRSRLLDIAVGQFATAEGRGLVGKPLLWRLDRAAMVRDLTRFYGEEGDLEPLAAELEFGTGAPGADPAVTVSLSGGRAVRFKGKADRVDRARSGELVVSDYKTGRQRILSDLKKDPVAGGRLLQLPIYAMAALARFGGDTVRARYWLLSEKRLAPSYSVTITDEVQARFVDILDLIASAVEAGAFPGAPTEKHGDRQFDACRLCDFDVLCPATRARQWARKSRAPAVAPVLALMGADVPGELAGAVVDGFGDDAGEIA